MTMIQTSVPDINALLPRGLPPLGVTHILGAYTTIRTAFAIDIVREELKNPKSVVTVVTNAPSMWRLAINTPRLHIVSSFNSDENNVASLVVVDDGPINALVINYSTRGPVLLVDGNTQVTSGFAMSSLLTLQINRVEGLEYKMTIVKPSYETISDPRIKNGASANFKVDAEFSLQPANYQEPVLRSAWDRLLEEDA
jgi:hypothetical protein